MLLEMKLVNSIWVVDIDPIVKRKPEKVLNMWLTNLLRDKYNNDIDRLFNEK